MAKIRRIVESRRSSIRGGKEVSMSTWSESAGAIEGSILSIRDHRVMLDTALARLYGVTVKVLNQAVRRNRARFPLDFMFSLSMKEGRSLRSQIGDLYT